MLSDLAHELRTPLATLESHLEAIEDGVRALDDDTLRILRTATGRLGVMSREVGQSGDRWPASEGGVGSVVIVEVQPGR